VTCCIARWFTRPHTVTHPSINRVSINYVDRSQRANHYSTPLYLVKRPCQSSGSNRACVTSSHTCVYYVWQQMLHIHRVPKKPSPQSLAVTLSNLNRFKKNSFNDSGRFAIRCSVDIPPHLTYVATLPCET